MIASRTPSFNEQHTVQQLGRYNEQDLIVAKGLRAAALRKLQDAQTKLIATPNSELKLECAEIRSLASAIESAQKVARPALGASIENRVHVRQPS